MTHHFRGFLKYFFSYDAFLKKKTGLFQLTNIQDRKNEIAIIQTTVKRNNYFDVANFRG